MTQLGQPPAYETWRIALTIGGSVVTLASLAVTAYVLLRTKTAQYWKDERDAALAKVERVTEENEQLKAENKALKEKVVVLEAQRDLTSVQEGQAAIVRAVDALTAREDERHAALMNVITQNTRTLLGFQSQMAGVFDAHQHTAAEMVLLLKDINNNTRP